MPDQPAAHEHVVDPHHGQSQQLISITRVIICNVFVYEPLSGPPLLITFEDLSKAVDVKFLTHRVKYLNRTSTDAITMTRNDHGSASSVSGYAEQSIVGN